MNRQKVIFRVDHAGIFAALPAIAGTKGPGTCMSYAHIGQHGICDTRLSRYSRPATKRESADLRRELTRLGYELRVGLRASPADFRARLQQINRTTGVNT